MDNPTFRDKLSHAWNAFRGLDSNFTLKGPSGTDLSSVDRYIRSNQSFYPDKKITSAIYNKIAIEVSKYGFIHAKVDENGNYLEPVKSKLNRCLTEEANVDQSAKNFIMDLVLSLFDEGVVAVVPVDTDVSLNDTGAFDVLSMRVGKITDWHPQDVKIDVYNELTGKRKELIFSKRQVAIVYNPFYSVMNEANSTLRRLISKLSLLDAIDKQSGSGKLDLIIQLPYVVKTETKQAQAAARRAAIENQIQGSKYGIAYIDGSERITQLNRPVENNLLAQVQYLTEMLFSELGITKEIMNNQASEQELINFYNATIEPVATAISDAFNNRFLTTTAKSQGHKIVFKRDPFKMVPVSALSEMADKFTRNEILTGNEIRGIIGFRPSSDPTADELRNKNLSTSGEDRLPVADKEVDPQNGS